MSKRDTTPDKVAAKELYWYVVNNPRIPAAVIANLKRKHAQGKYVHSLAIKAFENLANSASMKYSREEAYSRENIFDVPTRKHAARELADHFKDEITFKSNPQRVVRSYYKKRRK